MLSGRVHGLPTSQGCDTCVSEVLIYKAKKVPTMVPTLPQRPPPRVCVLLDSPRTLKKDTLKYKARSF